VRTKRKIAALLALLAITLQGLWPLLAQARPAMSVPICSADFPGHSIEIPVGNGDNAGEHCKLCVLGADKAVVSPDFAFALLESFAGHKSEPGKKSHPTQSILFAHPRAPPAAS